jgi:hypothetical protein
VVQHVVGGEAHGLPAELIQLEVAPAVQAGELGVEVVGAVVLDRQSGLRVGEVDPGQHDPVRVPDLVLRVRRR